MLRRTFLSAAPALILPSSRGFAQEASHNHAEWAQPRVMDECLVKLKPGHDLLGDWVPVLKRHGGQIRQYFPHDRLVWVRTSGKDCEILAADLEASNAAEKVTPNLLLKKNGTPNDPYYTGTSGTQPNFTNIGCPTAWGTLQLNGRRDTPPVIDLNTGCQLHTDIAANVITGWNIPNGNTSTPDVDVGAPGFGHGTSCAGLVCAVTNNSVGIASLGWGGTLMPICVYDNSNIGSLAYFIAGLQWILDNVTTSYGSGGGKGAINISISIGADATYVNTLRALWNAGFFIAGAAGDTGTAFCVTDPCASPYVVSCGSVTSGFVRDSYSNYGPPQAGYAVYGGAGVTVCAIVGSAIQSVRPTNSYGTYNGTSYAAPQVNALAQYMWAANPKLRNSDIFEIITNPANGIATTGFGSFPISCINADAMLQAAINWTGSRHAGRGRAGRSL